MRLSLKVQGYPDLLLQMLLILMLIEGGEPQSWNSNLISEASRFSPSILNAMIMYSLPKLSFYSIIEKMPLDIISKKPPWRFY